MSLDVCNFPGTSEETEDLGATTEDLLEDQLVDDKGADLVAGDSSVAGGDLLLW